MFYSKIVQEKVITVYLFEKTLGKKKHSKNKNFRSGDCKFLTISKIAGETCKH